MPFPPSVGLEESMTETEEAVRSYILSEIMFDKQDVSLNAGDSLLEGGVIDSMDLQRLIIFLEDRLRHGGGERLDAHVQELNQWRLVSRNKDEVLSTAVRFADSEKGGHGERWEVLAT